ncbi:hypothetical protein OIU78_011569 [Salix suchowensis]|nr:hypothetical protein OIU78_011569 [Salix suchowensis]
MAIVVSIWPWQTYALPLEKRIVLLQNGLCVVVSLNIESSTVEVRGDAARLVDVSYTEAERTKDTAGDVRTRSKHGGSDRPRIIYKQKLTGILQLDRGLAC